MRTLCLFLCVFAPWRDLPAATVSWDLSPDPTVLGYRVHWGDGESGPHPTVIDAGQGALDRAQSLRILFAWPLPPACIVGFYVSRVSAWFPTPPRGTVRRVTVTAYAAGNIESLPSNEVSIPPLVKLEIAAPAGHWTLEESADLATWKPSALPWQAVPGKTPPGFIGPAASLRATFQIYAHAERLFFRLREVRP